MEPRIPAQAQEALQTLQRAGFEAYLVGGCVRDSLLGLIPHDWDITTSALPEETARLFSSLPLVRQGEKHGTILLLFPGLPLEITTFRIDGPYADHRRPEAVRFSRSLREDLARRDFTINAMAWNRELIDPFDGERDLSLRRIRCVGPPRDRLEEDSLRILRALRFASCLSFSLEEATAAAVLECRNLLGNIAAERIADEFLRLLCGRDAPDILRRFRPVFEVFLPELGPLAGLDQHSPYHQYDVWEHTLHALEHTANDPELRLAVLLHDIGKPLCKSVDANGGCHFRGHQEAGAAIAKRVCTRLRLSRQMTEHVTALVRYHDFSVACGEANVRRWLNRLGVPLYRKLLEVNRADTLAHASPAFRRLPILDQAEEDLERIEREGQCWSLDRLAVNGRDLAAYAQGPALGKLLHRLLDAVIDGDCPNDHDALMALAARLVSQPSG